MMVRLLFAMLIIKCNDTHDLSDAAYLDGSDTLGQLKLVFVWQAYNRIWIAEFKRMLA